MEGRRMREKEKAKGRRNSKREREGAQQNS